MVCLVAVWAHEASNYGVGLSELVRHEFIRKDQHTNDQEQYIGSIARAALDRRAKACNRDNSSSESLSDC